MKLLDTAVRTAITNKLRDHVILNSQAVPVYSRIVATPGPDTYINISSQSNTNGSDKQYFSIDHRVTIEIVHHWEEEADAIVIDELTNQVMELLVVKEQKNMPDVTGLIDFQFVSAAQINEIDETPVILKNILTFEAMIDEG